MKTIPVLSVAGSDCSGGAGVQADIKTVSALGCFAAAAVTAVTVQTCRGVSASWPVPAEAVAAQIRAVCADLRPRAVKIGMLAAAATVGATAVAMGEYRLQNADAWVVCDPVVLSSSGFALLDPEGVGRLKAELFPSVDLLTPNIPETEMLAAMGLQKADDFDRAARRLMDMGVRNVLIKGGHARGAVKIDRLYTASGRKVMIEGATVATTNSHGTGCTLSSAIAAFLARGEGLEQAVRLGKRYVEEALRSAADIASDGNGPLNHFFNPQPMILR